MKNFLKIIATLLFGTGLVFFAVGMIPKSDVRITYEYTATNDDGSQYLYARSVRTEKANGDYEETIEYLDPRGGESRFVTTVGIGGKGVYRIKPSELQFLGARPVGMMRAINVSAARARPEYRRDDVIAGEAAVVQSGPDNQEIAWGISTGTMLGWSDGSNSRTAVKVERGRFAIRQLPDLPVTTGAFEERVSKIRLTNPEVADRVAQERPN